MNDGHHAPWELVPYPDLSASQLNSIIDKHCLPRPVRKMEPIGVINTVYLLGDELVLRVPRNVEEGIGDTYTEAVAAPTAREAGVRTPELVVFDDDRDILNVPYTVYERVDGQPLGIDGRSPHDSAAVYEDLGRDLGLLHTAVTSVHDPHGHLDTPARLDPELLLPQLHRRHLIGDEARTWLEQYLGDLLILGKPGSAPKVFCHNDTQPPNVLHRQGRYAALIDWGDAGFGDPVFEFRHMPMRAVPYALAGYRQTAPLDDTAESRIMFDHLMWALLRLTEAAGTQRHDWCAPQAARLLELVAFAVSGLGPDKLPPSTAKPAEHRNSLS